MNELALQRISKDTFKCFSEEDVEVAGEYPLMKILRAKISGALRPRSYEQLQTFWCACRTVAENTEDPNWDNKDKVAEQVKIKLQHIKSYIVVDNAVHIVTGSISYAEMKHLEACRFFDRAWPIMADKIGITVDELLKNVRRK